MTNSIYTKFFCSIFAVSLLITSCTKEDMDMDIVEEEKMGATTFYMNATINGVTYEHLAHASYCNANDKEFFQVTNRPEFLTDSLDFNILKPNDGSDSTLEVGDFMLIYSSDYNGRPVTMIGTATEGDDGVVNAYSFFLNEGDESTYNLMLDGAAAEGSVSAYVPYLDQGPFVIPETTFSVAYLAEIGHIASFCE